MDKFNSRKYIDLKNRYKSIVNVISFIRLVIFILIVISFIVGSSLYIFNYIGICLIVLFIILIFVHDRYYKYLDYYEKYLLIIYQYQDRIDGKWRKFSDKGIEFSNDLFDDLDIVGDNSLFQYLSVCKSLDGRYRLIDKLSNKKISYKKIKDDQDAISELSSNINFCIDFQVKMLGYDKDFVNFGEGLDILGNKVGNKKIDFIIGLILSFISILLLILGLLHVISISYFYGIFIFNYLANYMYSYIYRLEFDGISYVSCSYSKLNYVFDSIINNRFNSSKLNKMYDSVLRGKVCINSLVRIDNLNNLKNYNFQTYFVHYLYYLLIECSIYI